MRSRALAARRTAPGVARIAVVAAAVALIPVLAGCAAGNNAQTNQITLTTDGTNVTFHNIAIRNVFVLGPPIGGTLRPGEAAGVFLALVNDGLPDKLTAVSAPGTAAAVIIRGGGVALPSGTPTLLTGPQPQVVLKDLQKQLSGGIAVPMTLYFQNAGQISITVPVLPHAAAYATFLPPPTASPTPRLAKTPHPTQSPAGATRSPSPTATP